MGAAAATAAIPVVPGPFEFISGDAVPMFIGWSLLPNKASREALNWRSSTLPISLLLLLLFRRG